MPQPAWDALADGSATPFLRWHWLEALESSGCATAGTGWQPCHLTLWRGDELVAAAPAYLKESSDGDFSRDWGWADAAHARAHRLLPEADADGAVHAVHRAARPGARRAKIAPSAPSALVAGARRGLRSRRGLSSVHVLFPLADEAHDARAARAGAARLATSTTGATTAIATFDEFLARFDSKKRNQAKRERAVGGAARASSLRTVREAELRAEPQRWADAAYELHRSTVDKLMWGRRWLNRAFYRRIVERMPENLELVVAERARTASWSPAPSTSPRRPTSTAATGAASRNIASYISTCACITRSTSASGAASRCSRAAPAASTRSRAASSRPRPTASHLLPRRAARSAHPRLHRARSRRADAGARALAQQLADLGAEPASEPRAISSVEKPAVAPK